MTAYRAFTDDSWWNKPMPSAAPIDSHSAGWITTLTNNYDAWIKLTIDTNNAQAICDPISSDPLYTVTPSGSGPTVTFRIPTGFQPGNTSFSAKLLSIDTTTNQGVQLFGAGFSGGNWTATGTDRYYLDSNGLDESQGGATGNSGHRGATSTTRAPRLEEVKTDAQIRHRIQMFMPPTMTGPDPVFPMTGSDGSNASGIPEGTVLRVKQSVNLVARGLTGGALVVARCLQVYGAMVADGGAATAATIRMERGDWTGSIATKDAMSALTWSDYEFIQGGYDPPSPVVAGNVDTPGQIGYDGRTVSATVSMLVSTPGAITYAGRTVALPRVITVVTPGALTFTGKTTPFTRALPVAAGAITFTGQTLGAIGVSVVTIVVSPGQVTYTGQAVPLRNAISVSAGVITITGSPVSFNPYNPSVFLEAEGILVTSYEASAPGRILEYAATNVQGTNA